MENISNPANKISKQEWLFLALFALIVAFLVFLPHIYGYFSTPPGKIFTHLTIPLGTDYNSYFSWIKQAEQGKITFELLYTTEPQRALFFNPLFLLIGFLSFLTRLPIIFWWYTFMLTSIGLFFFSLYLFISFFIKTPAQRFLALFITTFSSGLGIWLNYHTADLFMPEVTIFNSLRWPFVYALALSFMLLFFLNILRWQKDKDKKYLLFASASSLALALIHPYDIILIIGISSIYFLLFNRSFCSLKSLFWAFLPAVIVTGYNVLTTYVEPVLKLHAKAKMASPSPFSYVTGFGIIIIPAAWSFFKIIRERRKGLYFLLTWSAVGVLLLYIPLTFQRKLALGLVIPLDLLASYVIYEWWLTIAKFFKQRKFLKINLAFYLIFLFLILGADNLSLYSQDLNSLRRAQYPFYLDKNLISSFEWLKKNSSRSETVLASCEIGNFIPRYTGNKTFAGHWAQTLNIEKKAEEIDLFYVSRDAAQHNLFLIKNNIKYVILSPYEKEKYKINSLEIEGRVVFDNDSVKIYEFR